MLKQLRENSIDFWHLPYSEVSSPHSFFRKTLSAGFSSLAFILTACQFDTQPHSSILQIHLWRVGGRVSLLSCEFLDLLHWLNFKEKVLPFPLLLTGFSTEEEKLCNSWLSLTEARTVLGRWPILCALCSLSQSAAGLLSSTRRRARPAGVQLLCLPWAKSGWFIGRKSRNYLCLGHKAHFTFISYPI